MNTMQISLEISCFASSKKSGVKTNQKSKSTKSDQYNYDLQMMAELLVNHSEFKNLEKKIHYNFKNNLWPLQAMTHRSFKNEFKLFDLFDNERLEFLGDSLLNTLITVELFKKYKDMKEGTLSKFRSALVNGSQLAKIGRYLGMSSVVLMGKGEIKNRCHENENLQAQLVEALIASIYMDLNCDYNALSDIVMNFLLEGEKNGAYSLFGQELLNDFDEISKLQEIMMGHGLLPEYKLISSGANDSPPFVMSLSLFGKEVASVTELSKKSGQKRLAQIALSKLINNK
ncbi:MAG: hypothetical protein HQK49_19445 [Oligoflexia bacterium]|nr:hypothetical protein [Oligoflexia bacterium]